MNRLLFVWLSLLWVSWSHVCDAAVFERDWKASGDGLLTYDDVNNREWLDLSETLLVKFSGDTLESRYESLLTELRPGGMFEGFTAAKREDVTALAASAGTNVQTNDFGSNATAVLNLIEHLGQTLANGEIMQLQSRGFIDEISTSIPTFPRRVEAIYSYLPPQGSSVGHAGLLIFAGDDLRSPNVTGAMLYRLPVPELSSLILAIAYIAGLFAMRLFNCRPERRRHNR